MSDVKAFLKHVEMFIGLTDDKLEKVASHCVERTFSADSIIIERNSPADNFFLVRDGTVEIVTSPNSETGERQDAVIVTLGKGQSFGEMSLIDSGTRSATVRAATETELYEIDCNNFRELCEIDTDVGFQIMRNIATDLSFKLRSRNLI